MVVDSGLWQKFLRMVRQRVGEGIGHGFRALTPNLEKICWPKSVARQTNSQVLPERSPRIWPSVENKMDSGSWVTVHPHGAPKDQKECRQKTPKSQELTFSSSPVTLLHCPLLLQAYISATIQRFQKFLLCVLIFEVLVIPFHLNEYSFHLDPISDVSL